MSIREDIIPVEDEVTKEVLYFIVSKQYLLDKLDTLVSVDERGVVGSEELKGRIEDSEKIEYYPDDDWRLDIYNIYEEGIIHRITQVIDLQKE